MGFLNDRLDGVSDILHRADGKSILDVGCSRGMVALQFVMAGATLVHGCDIYEPGLQAAREVFADWPVSSRFENINLAGGPDALTKGFGNDYQSRYDIVLYLAIHHKLKRLMDPQLLIALLDHIFSRTGKWFVWRGPVDGYPDIVAGAQRNGFSLVQYSIISEAVTDPAAIFCRK